MKFDPKDEDIDPNESEPLCEENWRVSKSSCWTQWDVGFVSTPSRISAGWLDPGDSNPITDPPFGGSDTLVIDIETHFEPCDASCCIRLVEVCKVYEEGSNTITTTITDLGLISEGSSCTATKEHLFSNFDGSGEISVPCEYDCNDLDSYQESFKSIGSNNVTISDRSNLLKIQMYEQIYRDQIELNIKDSDQLKLTVTLSDLNGFVIARSNYQIMGKQQQSFNLDISQLKSGTYIYRIDVNGAYFKSNKFNIVR